MSYQVALTFEDGVTRFVTAQEDQTVAEASYRARINIPVDCLDGACGTCKAFCESGDYDHGYYIEDALTEAEAAQGYCLPCQMKPKSDLVIQIPSTSEVARTVAGTFGATVVDIQRYADNVIGFTVEMDERDELSYLPGQYVNIEVPGTQERRSYSFSSAPDEQKLDFLIKITPGGVMSTWLAERAAVGDRLTLHGPNGSFFLREGETPLLLLAGGTGLAPILAMLRKSAKAGSTRAMHLIYGVNTDAEAVQLDVLDELRGQLPNFTWEYCVADPQATAERKGYVTAHMDPKNLYEGKVSVYLCGPPPMVEAVRVHFQQTGLEPEGFYYEKFSLNSSAASRDHGVEELESQVEAAELGEALVEEIEELEAALGVVAAARPAGLAGLPDGVVGRVELSPPGEDAYALLPGGRRDDREPLGSGRARLDHDPTAFVVTGLHLAGTQDEAAAAAAARAIPAGGTTGQQAYEIVGLDLRPTRPVEPLHATVRATVSAPGPAEDVAADGYVIGEEHPSIHKSDSLFDARTALEIGAMELTMGRLTSQQLTAYRMLADQTAPYVEGDHFVDAPQFTETNAVFHEFPFTVAGMEHLLEAYRRLGVKGEMHDVLDHATWCHPDIVHEHFQIVEAFAGGDRDRARELIRVHAEHGKETMRQAMRAKEEGLIPAFVSPGRFGGKVVVVTGAAQGIGERVARRIAAEGGTLVLADRSDLLDEVVFSIEGRGATVTGVKADLETFAGAQQVVDKAISEHGRVDVAIHVVGGTIWRKPFEEYREEEIEKEIRRSLFPTLWSCRAVLPHMYEKGRGTILNVSSTATMGLNRLPYAAAKGGVNTLTKSLAFEAAAHGVRVVATAPGGTDAPPRRIPRGGEPTTPEEERWHQTTVDQTIESSLLKRYGTLDEQAAAICFLASDEAGYITGTILPVAGGDFGG